MKEKILKVLNKIKPSLRADGGDIEFISWDEKKGVVEVSLTGMCAHCPMSQITLKEGVEKELKKEIPEVKKVINILKI